MVDAATSAGRSFADLLRGYRVRAALTQEELAEASGLSVRGLRYLERGLGIRPGTASTGWPRRSPCHRWSAACWRGRPAPDRTGRACRRGRGHHPRPRAR
ncbi:helix-turn-helix domain-containing protein [Geodermatophilus telluris]|uniref:helix-turn-helix transcriptional regulator n=1 Tax=Geodermatophilus telluris TaxID=1190417 RepID=UPI000B877CE5